MCDMILSRNTLFCEKLLAGELFLRQKLDYEDDKTIYFKIIASDCGEVPNTDRADVVISVVDENDNSPSIRVSTVFTPRPQVSSQTTIVSLRSFCTLLRLKT